LKQLFSYSFIVDKESRQRSSAILYGETFSDWQQLQDFSPVIIKATTTNLSRLFPVMVDEDENYAFNYTKTDVTVDQVIKSL